MTNRLKELDQKDRVPEELWMEVQDTVQEAGIKTIPMEKKCKKAKWLSEEALQIAVKIRETKSKGEKERYIHLNAECGPLEKGMANHFSILAINSLALRFLYSSNLTSIHDFWKVMRTP